MSGNLFSVRMKPDYNLLVKGFSSNLLPFTIMKTILTIILAFASIFMLTSTGSFANGSYKPEKGVNYSLTNHHLSPKQFSKSYKAEKREYRTMKNTSFSKMMKKRHGSRLYRWIQRNF